MQERFTVLSREELEEVTKRVYDKTKADVLPLLGEREMGVELQEAEAQALVARETLNAFARDFPEVGKDLERLGFKPPEGEVPELSIEYGLRFLGIEPRKKRLVRDVYPRVLKTYFRARGKHRALFEPVLEAMPAERLGKIMHGLETHPMPYEFHKEVHGMAKRELAKKK